MVTFFDHIVYLIQL